MYSLGRDIASELLLKYVAANASLTAAGTGDATEVVGASIDTTALGVKCESVAFAIAASATLAATKTLTVAAKVEHSDDGSSWSDLVASSTILTLTGASGGSTERGTAKIGVALENAKQFIRFRYTPDLSNTATDTATVAPIGIFGGARKLPQ
jgi:hypothetical protein